MASSDDESSGEWGERGSPPRPFGCFTRTFRRRRRVIPSSSLTAAVDSTTAASESGGRWRREEAPCPPTEMAAVISSATNPRTPRARIVPWDDIPLDKDHQVLSYTKSFYDRCRLRCVCWRWYNATRMDPPPPAPLPLVVTADFCLLNIFADGFTTVAREIKMPEQQIHGHRIACIGSHDSWLVCVCPRDWDVRQSVMLSDLRCFLFEPSRQFLIMLPDPPSYRLDRWIYDGSVPVQNSSATMTCVQPTCPVEMSLIKVVLSMSSYQVAALSERRGRGHLALCMPGMFCWVLCSAEFISIGTDLEFFKGQLYLLANDNADLYVLDFGPGLCHFPKVLNAQRCLTDPPLLIAENSLNAFSLVSSKENLFLVIRQFHETDDEIADVRVYMLENQSVSWRWNEIQTLNSNCIMISSAHNNFFPASVYDELEEDTIYFLDSMTAGFLPNDTESFSYTMVVYRMRDRSISRCQIGSKVIRDGAKFPMWYCPTE